MDWKVSDVEQKWQDRAQALAKDTLAPSAQLNDRSACFPRSAFNELIRKGFFDLAVPKEFGGQWAGYLPYILSAIEIATGDASVMCMLSMHFGCVMYLLAQGTESQKQRYLSAVHSEAKFFGVATADSSAGDPPTVGHVTALAAPGGWRLSGRRHFVTGAGEADWLIVRAYTSTGEHRFFIVDQKKGTGLTVENHGEGLGLRASATYTVVFEDCPVADQDVLMSAGHPSPFLPAAGFGLGLAATVLGPALAATAWTRETLKCQATGNPATISQERRHLLAEMTVDSEAARQMLLHAAWIGDYSPSALGQAVQSARFVCARNASEVTRKAMLACGGRSYLTSCPVERWARDAAAGPLQAGCHETCPDRLAEILLQ